MGRDEDICLSIGGVEGGLRDGLLFLDVRWLAVQRSNGGDFVDVLVGCLLFLARGRVESSQYVHLS